MTLRVQVGALDIAHGRRHSCYSCPVARAINRAAGAHGLVGATVSSEGRFRIHDRAWMPLPPAAVAWVAAFDSGLCVVPLDFDLQVAEPANA